MLVLHHVDLQHQLAVPLLRPPALRHRRRVAQPRVAGAAHVRRGVAQQPPRVPDLGRARAAPLAGRPLGAGDLGAREARPGLGRRARQPRAPGAQSRCRRPRMPSRSTAPLREALAEALPERPFTLELLGRHRAAADQRRRARRFTCARRAALAHVLRAPGPARARPRLRERASSRSTTSTRRSTLLDSWKPPPLDRARQGARWRSPPRARAGLERCRRAPGGRAAPARAAATAIARDRARGPPPLRRLATSSSRSSSTSR